MYIQENTRWEIQIVGEADSESRISAFLLQGKRD
jgi:hypothetical protein